MSAGALVLVPGAAEWLSPEMVLGLFMAGGVVFYLVDKWVAGKGSGGRQTLAMLLDFIPESLALGALLALGDSAGLLLALMIALQNLPEGLNAFWEMRATTDMPAGKIIWVFFLLALLGPIAACIGLTFLVGMQGLLGGIVIFAAGGILYLLFEDIAPEAVLENRRFPSLGAVASFALGLAGTCIFRSARPGGVCPPRVFLKQ